VVALAVAAAAAFGVPAAANATARTDPPVGAGLSVFQFTPSRTITCSGPVVAGKSRSVIIGDVTSTQDQPMNDLINDRSVTSFTMNCDKGVISGTMTADVLNLIRFPAR